MDTPQIDYLTKTDFRYFEKRLWERFDRNDNLSRALGERMAIVEVKANENELRLDTHATDTKKTAAGWGASVGTAAAAFVYGLITFLKGHGQ